MFDDSNLQQAIVRAEKVLAECKAYIWHVKQQIDSLEGNPAKKKALLLEMQVVLNAISESQVEHKLLDAKKLLSLV